MADIDRAEDYFRRSKDRGGDEKLLARGLLHLAKHLELDEGRDFGRATELLDRAWKKVGSANKRLTSEAMYLVARGLKKKLRKKRVKGSVVRNEFGIIVDSEVEDEEVVS